MTAANCFEYIQKTEGRLSATAIAATKRCSSCFFPKQLC